MEEELELTTAEDIQNLIYTKAGNVRFRCCKFISL